MLAIAIAIVIAVLVAAVAYAGPKLYWYHLQSVLIREQGNADMERFVALKESHDDAVGHTGTLGPQGERTIAVQADDTHALGQYL